MSVNNYNDNYSYPSSNNYTGSEIQDQQAFIINSTGSLSRRNGGYTKYSEANTSSMPTGPQKFDDYKSQEPAQLDINSLVLPPPNLECYVEPMVPRGTVTYLKHEEPTITRTITLNFNSVKTVVRENTVHHQHNKTVVTNVNRNHWHTQRILVKDNNYHHYLINNVVRINDIHHQKIEQVRGEGKSFNDFKQTQRIEAANCEFTDKNNKSDAFGTTTAANGNANANNASYGGSMGYSGGGNTNANNASYGGSMGYTGGGNFGTASAYGETIDTGDNADQETDSKS